MAYSANPLRPALNRHFQEDGDTWSFSCPGLEGVLPVSEEDVLLADVALKTYFARARLAALVPVALGTVWIFWRVAHAAPTSGTTVLVTFAVAFIPMLFASMLALHLTIRPFMKRLALMAYSPEAGQGCALQPRDSEIL
jgi:hypothetical protein